MGMSFVVFSTTKAHAWLDGPTTISRPTVVVSLQDVNSLYDLVVD
jgi:hypothetical protein